MRRGDAIADALGATLIVAGPGVCSVGVAHIRDQRLHDVLVEMARGYPLRNVELR